MLQLQTTAARESILDSIVSDLDTIAVDRQLLLPSKSKMRMMLSPSASGTQIRLMCLMDNLQMLRLTLPLEAQFAAIFVPL